MANKENSCTETNMSCFECNLSLSRSRHLINIAEEEELEEDEVAINKRPKVWHSECFKCNICKQLLDRERSCFVFKNKIVCREDYTMMQTNLSSCKRCRYPLSASDWVMKVGLSFAYHLACFTCDVCSRELKTGDKFIIEQREKTSIEHTNGSKLEHILTCERHFVHSEKEVDADHQMRQAKTVATADQSRPNKSNRYDSNVGIEQIYEETQPITDISNNNSGELNSSFHGRWYHESINQQKQQQQQQIQDHPSKGNYLTVQTNETSSELHQMSSSNKRLNMLMMDEIDTHDLEDHADSSSRSSDSSQFSESHKESHQLLNCATSSGSGSTTNNNHHHHHSNSSLSNKSKRVRTTFTEEQLAILQTHFQSDSNPDGQDLERIATITGLSKRVTQVWFQNSRARQKKYMIKRKPNSIGLGLGMSIENQGVNDSNNNSNATTMHNDLAAPGCSSSNISQLNNTFDNNPPNYSNNNQQHRQLHNQQKHGNQMMSQSMRNYVDESICKWSPTSSDGDRAAKQGSPAENEATFCIKSGCNVAPVEHHDNQSSRQLEPGNSTN